MPKVLVGLSIRYMLQHRNTLQQQGQQARIIVYAKDVSIATAAHCNTLQHTAT